MRYDIRYLVYGNRSGNHWNRSMLRRIIGAGSNIYSASTASQWSRPIVSLLLPVSALRVTGSTANRIIHCTDLYIC